MNEPRSRERFVSLAENRVARAIKDIRLIGNLSNRSNYSYTDEDVKIIVTALKTELDNMKKRFETWNEPEEVIFRL
ncbi:MAG: hypothetical protein R8K46_05265 [Mariprofundaceae bacterium]